MGDPRKPKKKYQTPSHPWQKERLEEESELRKKYGTKNKKDIWRMVSQHKNLLDRAKKTVSTHTAQGKIEEQHLLQKVQKLGLLSENATVEDILNLKVEDYFQRRLQSVLVEKKMAHSMKQARQFITHGHIQIKGIKVTSPSYIVPVDEEDTISFAETSTIASTEHPERVKLVEKGTKKEKAEKEELLAKEKEAEKTEESPVKEEVTEAAVPEN